MANQIDQFLASTTNKSGGVGGDFAAELSSVANKVALGDPTEPIDMTDMHDIEMSQIPEPSTEWEVVVGNVGTVYSGPSEEEARAVYSEYEMGRGGRATGEPVTMMHDGEIVEEYPSADEELVSYPDDPMTDEEFMTPNTVEETMDDFNYPGNKNHY